MGGYSVGLTIILKYIELKNIPEDTNQRGELSIDASSFHNFLIDKESLSKPCFDPPSILAQMRLI